MMLCWRYEVAVLSALLLYLPCSIARQQGRVELPGAKWQPPAGPPELDFVPSTEQQIKFRDLGGQDVVHTTWHQLQKLEGRRTDKPRSNAPQAFVEIAWHYAKILFRFLFMNGPSKDRAPSTHQASTLNFNLARRVDLLKHAAALDDADSMFLLAEMSFYGNFSHPRDYDQAFTFYDKLATSTGNSTAQYMLGFLYATGIGGAVERDQAKALTYHTFAAEQDNIRSEMTLGFRYHAGIATARDCNKAAQFYKRVADKAIAYWRSGPPGGRHLVDQSHRWADETGGVYGEGASVSSSGINANRDKHNHASHEEVMEYLDMLARKGDLKATFALARMNYDGSRTHQRNLRKSQRLFMRIARQYWDRQGKVIASGSKGIDKIAGKAAAYIGRMFLRGEASEQSYEKAAGWFRRGIAIGDPHSQYLMGLMHRDGLGVPQDSFKAANYLRAAADDDFVAAQSTLGILFLDQGEVETASRYFELAARHGHPEAFYYLAELTHKGIGRERHCGTATASYKMVAERIEEIHSCFVEANDAYERGDVETAVVISMMAAEQGYESAQANTAYLIDEQTSLLSIPTISMFSSAKRQVASSLRNTTLALIYWTRSAKQANIDSLLKTGDHYLSGVASSSLASSSSSPPSSSRFPDPEKASTCYHTAAEVHHSAQALWNLGWMHENGMAVEQDFHMAKRYYDLALELNSEAYLPAKLALIKLRTRSYWNTFTGGGINGIQSEEDGAGGSDGTDKGPGLSFHEWVRKFINYADREDEGIEETAGGAGGGVGNRDGLDELDLQAGRRLTTDQADDYGDDGTMPHRVGRQHDDYYEEADIDDGLFETLIIIGIAAMLAFLIYYRQQRQLQQHQQQRQNGDQQVPPLPTPAPAAPAAPAAPGQGVGPQPTGSASASSAAAAAAEDGAAGAAGAPAPAPTAGAEGGAARDDRGFFPNPGDPDYPAWVAGGIGH